MPPSDDSTARVPLGPVGHYVLANIRQLRQARGLTYKELSDRLHELGRGIPALGLSRIERGNRRVDADDLVALALALGVNPAALLLPKTNGPDDEIELTPAIRRAASVVWRWADGRIPMPEPGGEISEHDQTDFERYARPVWDPAAFGPALPIVREAPMRQLELLTGMLANREAERAKLEQRLTAIEAQLRAERARNGHQEREHVQDLPVVTAIVTSELGVLVGRRQDDKPPWTFIAGEQDGPQERPEDTIIREVKEETGLRIEPGEVIGERVHPKTGRRMIYIAATPTHGTEVFVGDEEELAEVRWVSLAEADELMKSYGMFEPVHEYLARTIGGEER